MFHLPPLAAAFDGAAQAGAVGRWTWPYALAPRAGQRVPELAAGVYTLSELLRSIEQACDAELSVAGEIPPEGVVEVVDSPAELGRLLWAIESATGLELEVQEHEPLRASFGPRRGTDRQEGESHWASLPGLGYVSPDETAIGRAALATGSVGDAGLPVFAAWRLEDLPPLWTWGFAEPFLRRPDDPPLEARAITVLWVGGFNVHVQRGDGPSAGGWMTFLPIL